MTSCTFYIAGQPIKLVDSFSSLGHLITNQMDDSADILERRSNFTGQTNNMICHFDKLNLYVRNRLFQSNCTSLYGCELHSAMSGSTICVLHGEEEFTQSVELAYMTHYYLLPILSQCLPVFDETCRRSSKSIHLCLNNE